jgi:hypothetical protein
MQRKYDYTEEEVKAAIAWSLERAPVFQDQTVKMNIQVLITALDPEGVDLLLISNWFTMDVIQDRVEEWRTRDDRADNAELHPRRTPRGTFISTRK